MYKDFTEYWKLKEEMFKKLGIDKATAYTIWCDACNLCMKALMER